MDKVEERRDHDHIEKRGLLDARRRVKPGNRVAGDDAGIKPVKVPNCRGRRWSQGRAASAGECGGFIIHTLPAEEPFMEPCKVTRRV